MFYSLIKNKRHKTTDTDLKNISGFKVKPLNKINYDGVKVDEAVIINPSFIEKILKKKTKKKLETYLEFLIGILEDEESSDSGKISIALDDVVRFKSIINNTYRIYLDKRYYDVLLKKLEMIEKELKIKKMYLEMHYHAIHDNVEEQIYEEKARKSR